MWLPSFSQSEQTGAKFNMLEVSLCPVCMFHECCDNSVCAFIEMALRCFVSLYWQQCCDCTSCDWKDQAEGTNAIRELPLKGVWVRRPTGRRPRGGPRTRWRDSVCRLIGERLSVPEELEDVERGVSVCAETAAPVSPTGTSRCMKRGGA